MYSQIEKEKKWKWLREENLCSERRAKKNNFSIIYDDNFFEKTEKYFPSD